jgi:phage-related tail fiber protein
MAKYFATLTEIGEAKMARTLVSNTMVPLTEMAVGDGGIDGGADADVMPSAAQRALVRERLRRPLNRLVRDEKNPSIVIAEVYLPEEVGGWWLRELGLYDEEGDLVAVANVPPSYKPVLAEGSGRGQFFRMMLIHKAASNIVLKIDPAIVVATREYVDDEVRSLQLILMEKADKASTLAGYGILDAAPIDSPQFLNAPTAPTPAAGDKSDRLATTLFVDGAVTSAISKGEIGRIIFEARASVRAGCLKLNGALLQRDDYPALWSYAQSTGALVSDEEWSAGAWGCFSTGDGATTFRIPELRGEGLRCWDDGRGIDVKRSIGTWQDSQNRTHAHAGVVQDAGEHNHTAWTDGQGWHGHHGWTAAVGDHQHIAPYTEINIAPWGYAALNQTGSNGGTDKDNPWAYTSGAGAHNHEFNTEGAGSHGHNVGIGWAGTHSHAIEIKESGGHEARMRNVALLAMIRAY